MSVITGLIKSPIVVVAAKTITDPSKPITSIPNPKSNESTITTVSYEIRQAGGEAHPIQVDVRSEESINSLIEQTIAVSLSPSAQIPNRPL